MQLARVVGQAVSTVKHASLTGRRLAVVQPFGAAGKADGEPFIAIDPLGAGRGDTVVICSDGKGARELVGSQQSPVRWFILGIQDGGADADR